MRGAFLNRIEFLVVASLAGRDDRQSPDMQEPLQMPIARRVMHGVYGLVVLAEKLGAFLLRQVSENYLRVVWIVNLHRLCGHANQVTPGSGHPPVRSAMAALSASLAG